MKDLIKTDSPDYPLPRGFWKFSPMGPGDTRDGFIFTCPECGFSCECAKRDYFNLPGGGSSTHRVKPNGEVTPSVICGLPGCKFHDFIRLIGWNGLD